MTQAYQVITSTSLPQLTTLVNQAMLQGWTVTDGFAATSLLQLTNLITTFYQPMIFLPQVTPQGTASCPEGKTIVVNGDGSWKCV